MKSIEWHNGYVRFIDQSKLPLEEYYIQTDDYRILIEAIKTLRIRGAPLIGIAAAYGVVLASLKISAVDLFHFCQNIQDVINEFSSTRPTAVNLFLALNQMKNVLDSSSSIENAQTRLISEAIEIHREDKQMCEQIAGHGSSLIPNSAKILTHCNTGALATGGEGTALAIVKKAYKQNKSIHVYVGETRPLLQGARLTTWELIKAGIDFTLITDCTAAFLMKQKKIDLVIVGADRITRKGDVANKIGTYNNAVTAKYHNIPFYVAAPNSTIDTEILAGEEIKIEERSSKEIAEYNGIRIAPNDITIYSPAFDITPASLISAIITNNGIFYPPYDFTIT